MNISPESDTIFSFIKTIDKKVCNVSIKHFFFWVKKYSLNHTMANKALRHICSVENKHLKMV